MSGLRENHIGGPELEGAAYGHDTFKEWQNVPLEELVGTWDLAPTPGLTSERGLQPGCRSLPVA